MQLKMKLIPAAFAVSLALAGVPSFAAENNRGTATVALSSVEVADLSFMREEEKLARDTYLTLFDQWGNPVFSNIASSEQRHMDAILKLLRKYDLPDPAAGNLIGEFTDPELQALYEALYAMGMQDELTALKVGGIIEETDIQDIVVAIDNAVHPDIDKVYEHLLCGSRNHLRAFADAIEAQTGQAYTAQVISQAEVDAILDGPMERCGH
jgi:hypothetical protein